MEIKLPASNPMEVFIANLAYMQENINFRPFILKRLFNILKPKLF